VSEQANQLQTVGTSGSVTNAEAAAVPVVAAETPKTLKPIGALKVVKRRRRGLAALLAAVVIGFPTLLAAIYYGAIASDQYASEFRFSIRTPERPGEPGGALGNPAAQLIDAFVVTEFIKSRQALEEVNKEVPLRQIYSHQSIDWLSRLDPSVPMEELERYWHRRIDARFDALSGIVSVSAHAFAPQDAVAVARALVASSETMFQRTTARSREEVLRQSSEEVARAEERLRKARRDLREFREAENVVNPTRQADATAALVARLREDLARLNTELRTMSGYLGPNSPQISIVRARIQSTQAELNRVESEPSARSGQTAPQQLGRFEALETEVQFADRAYQRSLEMLDRARASAERRTAYLSLFVEPSTPQSAVLPRRVISVITVFVIAFFAWLIGILIVYAVRDHMV
jgi:capsular polysaccharide transport system permease protein